MKAFNQIVFDKNLQFTNLISFSKGLPLIGVGVKIQVEYFFCRLLIAVLMVSAELILLPNMSFAQCQSGITLASNEMLIIRDKMKLTSSITQLSLTIQPLTVEVGKLVFLTARLTDENGTPIENAEITFKLKNLTGILTTGSSGIAMLAFTPQVTGIYEIKAEYPGSSRYSSATKIGTIIVLAGAEILYLLTIVILVIAMVAIPIISYKRRIPMQ